MDVKTEQRLEDQDTAAVVHWTGKVCAVRGWDYEVCSGASSALLGNTKFLGPERRRPLVSDEHLIFVMDEFSGGQTLGEVIDARILRGGIQQLVSTAWLRFCGAGYWALTWNGYHTRAASYSGGLENSMTTTFDIIVGSAV